MKKNWYRSAQLNQNEYPEIEFICSNPEYMDSSNSANLLALYNDLQQIPNTLPYLQQFDDDTISLAVILLDDGEDVRGMIGFAAERNEVKIDFEHDVSEDYKNRIESGQYDYRLEVA